MSHIDDILDDANYADKIRQLIRESHERCRLKGLDPIIGSKLLLNDKELKEKLDRSSELIKVSNPIMNNLYKIVKGSGFIITLTDLEGYIMNMVGDEEIINESAKIHFIKGSLWTEETVGTNGIGIVLKNDVPVQIIGKDHYCERQHIWTCSAAPIHDDSERLIGCINLSGNCNKAHKHTLGMVLTAAYSIERQLSLEKSNELMNATFQSISDGMIILDNNLNIIKLNDKSCELLGYTKSELVGKNIKKIIEDVNFIESVLVTGKSYYDFDCDLNMSLRKIKCVINVVPIVSKLRVTGLVITFNVSKTIHKVANRVMGNRAIYTFEDIVFADNKIKKLINYAKKIAVSGANVLITGESGTGKELFAHAIHNYSNRKIETFIAINCASIPRELLESELFGYEKGAFTGAIKQGHIGKFELADGGTIFLDEIGELPLDMQAKLLRVLDNKMVSRIGGSYDRFTDVRVIAATNKNLLEEVKKNNFRMDLYYRLNVMNIKLIPLRERKSDIPILARKFVEVLNEKNLTNKTLSENYIKKLENYDWPGNIRELKNTIERSYFLSEQQIIYFDDLLEEFIEKENIKENLNKLEDIVSLKEVEAENIRAALKKYDNNAVKAAEFLGMGKSTIYRKIKKYDIQL